MFVGAEHGGDDPSCFNANFGDFVIWDRLFGTYEVNLSEPIADGCADPDGLHQSGRPLRDMVAVQAACLYDWRRLAQAGRARMAGTSPARTEMQPLFAASPQSRSERGED